MKVAPKAKSWLKAIAKVLGSGLCLYWLFTQIAWESILEVYATLNPWSLLPAVLLFGLSQLISVKRLGLHFEAEIIQLSFVRNLRLYVLGMFYSLFLPGTLGGDGYKMYWLKKHKEVSLSRSFRSLLFDRLNGLWALLFLALIFLLWIEIEIPAKIPLILLSLLGLYLFAYFFLRRFFVQYLSILFSASLLSLVVQFSQVLCIFSLLWGFGQADGYLNYGLIFLLGALASVIPLSIGGLGFRELVFLYGAEYLGLNPDLAVSLSLLFYVITAGVSLLGMLELMKNDSLPDEGGNEKT